MWFLVLQRRTRKTTEYVLVSLQEDAVSLGVALISKCKRNQGSHGAEKCRLLAEPEIMPSLLLQHWQGSRGMGQIYRSARKHRFAEV